jgi:hypothetical protein
VNTESKGAALQEIADRMAISDVIYRYCRAMDRIDAELGYSVWHEDGEADYGVIYRGGGRGFVDWICGVHRTMLAHSHRVTNVLITLDGDKAASESYVMTTLRRKDGDRLLQTTAWGRYLDRWSRRARRWAIDRRVYVHDFDEVREITETALQGAGRRDRDDPSYRVLES